MNIIPKDWLQECEMKRIIPHWTGGSYIPSSLDKEHYHILIDGEGKLHKGKYNIKDNENTLDDFYAKHTSRLNTNSIGVAVCCMFEAKESPYDPGKYPIKRIQFLSLVKVCAELLDFYKLPLEEKTCLTHAEVQRVYGIVQNGKWDIRAIPFLERPVDSVEFTILYHAVKAGNIIREEVKKELIKLKLSTPDPKLTVTFPAAEIILPGGDSIYIPAGWTWKRSE